jgi:hypothetical protein
MTNTNNNNNMVFFWKRTVSQCNRTQFKLTVKIQALWDTTLCHLAIVGRRFEGALKSW